MAKDGTRKRRVVSQTSPEDQFTDYNPNMPAAPSPPETKVEEPVAAVEPVAPPTPPIPPTPVVAPAPPQPEPAPEAKKDNSPLAHTGPMPAELLKDPFAVEIVPLTTVPIPPAPPKPKLLTQERMVWISAVGVSWAVTTVAVLRALRII